MEFLFNSLLLTLSIFIFIVVVKIYMILAAFIGEQLGFGKFIIYLFRQLTRQRTTNK